MAQSPEQRKVYAKQWRDSHKEQISEYNKKYHTEHYDFEIARIKQWRKNNPDKIREYNLKQWKKELREKGL